MSLLPYLGRSRGIGFSYYRVSFVIWIVLQSRVDKLRRLTIEGRRIVLIRDIIGYCYCFGTSHLYLVNRKVFRYFFLAAKHLWEKINPATMVEVLQGVQKDNKINREISKPPRIMEL
jgi:hypothetical protein